MSIPTYEEVMLPLLEVIYDGVYILIKNVKIS